MDEEGLRAASVGELIARALAAEDREDDGYFGLVAELQRRGGAETLERALVLCAAPSDSERRLGVDILGQLGWPDGRPYLEQSLPLVVGLCAPGGSADLLRDALFSLGQLADDRGSDVALQHLSHPDADVRLGVAHALGGIGGEDPDARLVDAIVELTRDPDRDVRNWATFTLALIYETDTAAVRDALAERIGDPDETTRAEALAGLVARGDPRANAHVLAWVEAGPRADPDAYVEALMLEAAAQLGDPEDGLDEQP